MQTLAIETTALTRRFDNRVAVRDLNLGVPEGCVFGFLGPNGAGKTATIRMLLGLIRPDSGEVRLFGAPLASQRQGDSQAEQEAASAAAIEKARSRNRFLAALLSLICAVLLACVFRRY